MFSVKVCATFQRWGRPPKVRNLNEFVTLGTYRMPTLLCCARSLDGDVTVLVTLFSFVTQNAGTAPSYFFEIRLDLLSVKVRGPIFSAGADRLVCEI